MRHECASFRAYATITPLQWLNRCKLWMKLTGRFASDPRDQESSALALGPNQSRPRTPNYGIRSAAAAVDVATPSSTAFLYDCTDSLAIYIVSHATINMSPVL